MNEQQRREAWESMSGGERRALLDAYRQQAMADRTFAAAAIVLLWVLSYL